MASEAYATMEEGRSRYEYLVGRAVFLEDLAKRDEGEHDPALAHRLWDEFLVDAIDYVEQRGEGWEKMLHILHDVSNLSFEEWYE